MIRFVGTMLNLNKDLALLYKIWKKMPYTNPSDPTKPGLKELLGRQLFEDENNPENITKPGATEPKIGNVSPDLASPIGGGKAGVQEPLDPNTPSTTSSIPTYKEPTGPQKNITGDVTALIILKNIMSSIVIEDRYNRAGDKKSFVSMYLKMQNRDRPDQIKMLSAATQNAAKELESCN